MVRVIDRGPGPRILFAFRTLAYFQPSAISAFVGIFTAVSNLDLPRNFTIFSFFLLLGKRNEAKVTIGAKTNAIYRSTGTPRSQVLRFHAILVAFVYPVSSYFFLGQRSSIHTNAPRRSPRNAPNLLDFPWSPCPPGSKHWQPSWDQRSSSVVEYSNWYGLAYPLGASRGPFVTHSLRGLG